MNALLLVGLGGAAGSMLRYLVQRSLNTLHFPFGTMAVNIAGGFLIGLLWGYFTKGALPESGRLLLMSGFCGGFTTFSAFTQEGVQMLQQGKTTQFFIYLAASVAAGLLATFAGYKLIS
ncbi:MAG: fluoride efflux transporter CrcB [Chitinophagaceae bacterium]